MAEVLNTGDKVAWLAVGLMAGATLLFLLAYQVPGDRSVVPDLLLWTSAVLAIAATTLMVMVTRRLPGRRLIPGAVSIFFLVLTVVPVYVSTAVLLLRTGILRY